MVPAGSSGIFLTLVSGFEVLKLFAVEQRGGTLVSDREPPLTRGKALGGASHGWLRPLLQW